MQYKKSLILIFLILLTSRNGFSQPLIHPNLVGIILAITAKKAIPLNSIFAPKIYSEEEKKNRKELLDRQNDSLRREIILHPKDPEPLFQRGLIKVEIGALEDAKSDFNKAIFLGKRTRALYMALAETCDRADAITCFNIVLRKDSSDYEALLSRGIVKLYRRESKKSRTLKQRCLESMADFTLVIKYKPDFVEALILRGYTNYILENYKASIRDLKHSIELDEMKEISWILLGKIYLDNDQPQDACKIFTTAKDKGIVIPDKLFVEACGK